MFRSTFRNLLVPLSALVLVVGLASPPATAGPSWPASFGDPLAGSPPSVADPLTGSGAATTDSAAPATAIEPAPAGRAIPTGSTPEPAGNQLLDLVEELEGPVDTAAPAAAAGRPAGVAPAVQTAVDADGEASVIIRLRDQVDVPALTRDAEQAAQAATAAAAREMHGARSAGTALRDAAHTARVAEVVEALQATANASQPEVHDLLETHQAADITPYWLFNGFSATVDAAALAALADHPQVASVTLNETIELDLPTLTEVGQPRLPVWGVDQVNAPDTWGEYGTRGAGVVVGVLDTGVDFTHPALAAAWRGNDGELDASWHVSTGENYPEPGDGHGHGTHVSGSILGAPPGEVIGVAPDAQWIASKGLSDFGTGSAAGLLESFEWFLAPGGDPANAPHVVNNSWGSSGQPHNTIFWEAVELWAAAGIVPIFSAGNEGPNDRTVTAPASYPHSIAIGATDESDMLAWFSSRGPIEWDGIDHDKPQVSAPGFEVISSLPGNTYGLGSGTSMAAPHASGVVALMLSAAPDLTVDEIREGLAATVRHDLRTAMPNGYGAGVVDAHAAVTWAAHSGTVTGTVHGSVTPVTGRPIGAEVTIAGFSTVADPETGEFTLRVPAGTHEVTAAEYGFRSRTSELTLGVGETVTVDLLLNPAPERTLTGTVVGPQDTPITRARVVVPDSPLPSLRTDDAGRFEVVLAEGSYQVHVDAPGHDPAVVEVVVDGDTDATFPLSASSNPSEPGWGQYLNNPGRTGLSDQPMHPEELVPHWNAQVTGTVLFANPVVGDGRGFITSENGVLTAFDLETGEQLWTQQGSATRRGTPAVVDGIVYAGGGSAGGFFALDATTGDPIWQVPTPGRSTIFATPTVIDGVVYVATGFTADQSDTVFALDAATGDELWSVDIGPRVFMGPAVADGLVVAASATDQRIVALDAVSGEQVWAHEYQGEGEFHSGPSVIDGTVYQTTTVVLPPLGGFPQPRFQGSVLGLDAATGELRFEQDRHGDGQGSTPIPYGDTVAAGALLPGMVSAYDRHTGEPAWHDGQGRVSASMVVTGDGYLISASQNGTLAVQDAVTGEVVWEEQLRHPILNQPTSLTGSPAFADGRLLVVDRFGVVHAFHLTGALAGTVTGPDGPVAGTVRLLESGEQVATDPETGEYSMPEISTGTYTVEFEAYGFESTTRTVEVVAGQTSVVDVELTALGTGSLAGVVRDSAGDPLPGATVTLPDTPLEPAVTEADGSYQFPEVAEGQWLVVADAIGYDPDQATVTISPGQATEANFELGDFEIAVVSDFEEYLYLGLGDLGWDVDRLTFDEVVGHLHRYDAVILAGTTEDRADEDLDRLVAIAEEADEVGTSLVILDQWSLAHGTLRPLAEATGDPAEVGRDLPQVTPVWIEDVVAHPITASLPPGERTLLLAGSVRAHAWFSGYSGISLGRVGNDDAGQRGDVIGYQPRSFDHNHVLLPMHAPAPSARPDTGWQPVMWDILNDAISHAAGTEYGAVQGLITDPDGEPVPATVELVDGANRTVAGDDGAYHLFLEPGEHTLRISHLGSETVEADVTISAGITHELNVTLPGSELGVLTGQVTDADTGAPIEGATVAVLDAGVPAAATNRDGEYLVTGIPGGTYDVEVSAEHFNSRLIEDVEIVDGEVTTLDATLVAAPSVAVVGDSLGRVTDFLNDHDIPAQQFGWEVVDELADVRVAILHNPPSISQEQFLDALAAFDEAGISVIFPADGALTRTRGTDLLIRHTGDPPGWDTLGSSGGPEILLHDRMDHPIFEGIEDDPVRLLDSGGRAAAFPSYRGETLAMVAEDGQDPAGIGIAYDIRTGNSVHLLLTGLARTVFNEPTGNWTEDGQRIFLNAIRWAAAPELARVTGVVTDSAGEPLPHAEVSVAGAAWQAAADSAGEFTLLVPAGEHTLRYRAFGYVDAEATVTVAPGQTVDAPATLEVGEVGAIHGTVTSDPGNGGGGSTASVAEAEVRLLGTPLSTTTSDTGAFTLSLVEPGSYQLEVEAEGHLRTRFTVEVTAGETTEPELPVRVSPVVGLLGDHDELARDFLEDWGYVVEEIGWQSVDEIAGLDLVVANLGGGSRLALETEELDAFKEAVNRARLSVLWLAQQNRGGIRELSDHYGDPASHGGGFNDGVVTATVVDSHPLVAGLPDEFPLMQNNGRYSFFNEFGGTTVATLATDDDGHLGDTIAYRGRTTGAVDVLLSTLSFSSWGHPATRERPAANFAPAAEQLLHNALGWALDAEGVGAEVLGTVESSRDGRVSSQVEVLENGRIYQGRAGDGTFLVPLQPGDWTLEVSAFGHESQTLEVTVAAGESLRPTVTMTPTPAGTVTGQLTGPDGEPLADTTVAVLGTPLSTTTGPAGGYTIETVPAGDWEVEARPDGHQHTRVPLTVADGQVTTVNITAPVSRPVAVAGDARNEITDLLTSDGYQVDTYLWHELDLIQDELDSYQLVVLNGAPTSGQNPSDELLTGFLDAAADADVSVTFASVQLQGSLVRLNQIFDDPGFIRSSFEQAGSIFYTADEPHPLFAGVDISEPIEMLTPISTNQQYMFYEDYSGVRLAGFEAPNRGESGDGAGFRFTSPQSMHLLLTNLMATNTASFSSVPNNWTDDAKRVYLNGIEWAIETAQAQLAGTVTGGGEPLAGARVDVLETQQSALTGPDGSYAIGLAGGTYHIEVSALGFETAELTVEVAETGITELDVDLVSLPRGDLTGTVTGAGDGQPVAGAELVGTGPMDWQVTTGADGGYSVPDLLPGEYEVTVTAAGFQATTFTATVVVDEVTVHDVALAPDNVGVLGDAFGALTEFLVEAGLAPVELEWSEDLDVSQLDVLVVNGGSPNAATFEAVLAAADEAEVSVIFTGTWAVDRGGIRLLEQFTDRVVVGEQGFGDGPVQLTGFDPDHPVFAGLTGDPATLIVEGGYYSVLAEYAGEPLADLHVERSGAEPVTGLAAGWDWRTPASVEVLLSASAVTEAVGPGLGWTEDGGQLVVDAIEWAREQVMDAPTLAAAEPVVIGEAGQVSGEAPGPWEVSVLRDGVVVATVPAGEDGSWSAEVPLAVGENQLTAVALSPVGESPSSQPVVVVRQAAGWASGRTGQRRRQPATIR